MECHYTFMRRYPNGYDLDELMQWMRQHVLYDETGRQDEDQELIEWMYEGHQQCYGTDPDWSIVEVEFDGLVDLGPGFKLRFKIDLLIRNRKTGQLWLVDHKSARDFSRKSEIDIDDQFGLYTWALRKLGYPVFGFIRSDARTQRNKGPMAMDNRFRRLDTYRTDAELENIARDAYATARLAYSADSQQFDRSSPAPDRCVWRCSFLESHLLVRKGFDELKVLPDFGFTKSEKKHREYETNPLLELIPKP